MLAFVQAIASDMIDIDAADTRYRTLLHYAAICGMTDAIMCFHEAGLDMNDPANSAALEVELCVPHTPIQYATVCGHLEAVQTVLAARASLSGALHSLASSVLYRLDTTGSSDCHRMLEALLAMRADPNEDAGGSRPLESFVLSKDLKAVRCLVQAAADPHANIRAGGCGTTALHMATYH